MNKRRKVNLAKKKKRRKVWEKKKEKENVWKLTMLAKIE